jgi:hypothetical protein
MGAKYGRLSALTELLLAKLKEQMPACTGPGPDGYSRCFCAYHEGRAEEPEWAGEYRAVQAELDRNRGE